ncbi:MAG: hypothetical protein V3S89_06975, partial [Desulfobacterales bacterium]
MTDESEDTAGLSTEDNPIDNSGVAIGAARMDPSLSYTAIPGLLKDVINHNDEEAWGQIRSHIDYTYRGLSCAMGALEAETGFSRKILERIERGQNLLFKPNLVSPASYDPVTHDPAATAITTPWPFVAALMRWFHDDLGISYHRMSLGEGATSTSAMAGAYTLAQKDKREITTQAVLEGRSGDFYAGWGFYFARKYLADSHDRTHTDDPMSGFEDSVAGLCLPPGNAPDKLLIYDLNKIDDDRSNGRDVPVPDGINFQTITLHKAI